jgi:hypothetical protein
MGLFALLPLGFPGFIPLGALTAATPARPSHAWLLLEHRHSDGVAMSSSDSAVKKAWSHFYQECGQAMLAWQLVESELATVFSMLTKIPPAMAIQIFYSARSFRGRIDIYKAGITVCPAPAEIKSIARGLIKKAGKYAEYRNKFAHDQPRLRQQGQPAKFDILLVDGKGQFQVDDVKSQYLAEAITVAEITEAAACFRGLADLTRDFWSQLSTRTALLDTFRERLLALPTLPPAKESPPCPPAR